MNEEFTTTKLITTNVLFLGWIKNSGTPVLQAENTNLYTVCNIKNDTKIGVRGDIYYKANSSGGNHYFEPNEEYFGMK